MATMKDLRDELDHINAILASGVASTSVDGVSTTFDIDSLRRRRREIERQLTPGKRPRVATMDISGAQ